MKEISIIEILELINKCLPNCYYSILFMDASFLPGPDLSDDITIYEQINDGIKNYSSGYTSNFTTILSIAKQLNDVKDLYVVVNKHKPQIAEYDNNERQRCIGNSLLEFFIEDLDLIELTSCDKSLEEYIKAKLGGFPIRVTVSLSVAFCGPWHDGSESI